MRSPIPDYLAQILGECEADGGEVADYIPELARADPDRLAIAIATLDGEVFTAGDAEVEFSIQSISKPFAYALAIVDRGLDAVLDRIDVEPSGDAFNDISLDPRTGHPRNPMINAGAIATHGLVAGDDQADRDERVRSFFSALAGRELGHDEHVYSSEVESADRNRAIAYLLRTVGVLEQSPEEVVRGYTRQCSIEVTVSDLARMAAVLAGGGRTADGHALVAPSVARQVLSVMTTCGMYDAAGDWLTTVGIPAKSGVSGGLIGVLPGQVGIAVFSPRLDSHGNSHRGVRLFERLSRDMGLHLMEAPESGRSVIRRTSVEGVDGFEIAGDLRFIEAERVLRALEREAPGEGPIVIDLTRVHRVNDVARRMLLEGVRRLELDGHPIRLVDRERLLGTRD